MKKILLIAMLFAFSAPVFAQSVAEVVGLQVNTFARQGSEVVVELTMDLDGHLVRPTDRWVITPTIQSGNTKKELNPIVVNGNNKRKMVRRAEVLGRSEYNYFVANPAINANVRSKKDGGVYSYRVTVPYESWMRDSELMFYSDLLSCSKGYSYMDDVTSMYSFDPSVLIPSYVTPAREEVKKRDIQASANVTFVVNKWEVRRDYMHNAGELDKIRASIDQVKGDSDFTLKSMHLHGYASPEGSYANNERLARERVNSLKNYVAANYGVPASNITTDYTPENWEGLKEMVERSEIEGKADVLAVINSSDAPDTKEAKLKALHGGRPWRVILNDMMPALRVTKYRVDFEVRDYTIEDSREMLRKNPAMMSLAELNDLALDYGPNSSEYARVYEVIERQYPNEDAANINVAAYKISKGDYAGAKAALNKVKSQNAAYHNNYAIVMAAEGNYQQAADHLRRANNQQSAGNLREVEKALERL